MSVLSAGLWVTILSDRYAEEWTRRIHNIPEDCGLGWKPYRVLVQSHGATAHSAYLTVREFRRKLRALGLTIDTSRRERGLRFGKIVAA